MELLPSQVNSTLLNYRADLEELSSILSCFGYNIAPYRTSDLWDFHRLDDVQQAEVSRSLNIYLQALKSEYASGDFSNERFVLQFLYRTGILTSDGLSESIHNEKFIQIYNRDQLQIFRSLGCFERCSFTLEQLTTRPWFELWTRESLFYYALFGLAATALKLIRFTKIKLDFPHHRVTEQDSFNNFSFDYKIKSLTGLTRQGKLQAALLIEDWIF